MQSSGIIHRQSSEEAAQALVDDVYLRLQTESTSGTPVLLLIAGGSVLDVVQHISAEAFTENVTVGVLDERLDPTNRTSNYYALKKVAALSDVKNIIDTSTQPSDTLSTLTERFSKALHTWKEVHPSGNILIIAGIGIDGHIAGMMPFPDNRDTFENLFSSPDWVVGYDAAGKNIFPYRVTATMTFFRLASEVFVYAVGAEKMHALEKTLAPGTCADTPARILTGLSARIYTDQKIKTLK